MFETFGRHPLLLQVLAGVVAEFRDSPGDFDAWHQANPDFRVFGLPLVQVRSHILDYALSGLTEAPRKVLHTIAGFRMPVDITTLRALFIRSEKEVTAEKIAEAMRSLTPREREVIELRFGLRDGHPRTLEEVAPAYAITRERIRQIEARGLLKLRQPLRSHRLALLLDDKRLDDETANRIGEQIVLRDALVQFAQTLRNRWKSLFQTFGELEWSGFRALSPSAAVNW